MSKKIALLTAASVVAMSSAALAQEPSPHVEQGPTVLDEVIVTADPLLRSRNDVVSSVAVLSGDELLHRRQATLGDTLSGIPGVNSDTFGAGASRPVIRGQTSPRVRVLSDGSGILDASDVSPDHAVTGEPLLLRGIEILRGPSSLLYGGGAIGGAVNLIDNKVPVALPPGGLDGVAELRLGTADGERSGVIGATVGWGNFALRLEGVSRDTSEYDIPFFAPFAEQGDHGPNHDHDHEASGLLTVGTLPGSFNETTTGTLGLSWIGARGYLGAAFTEQQSRYGLPGHTHAYEDCHPHGSSLHCGDHGDGDHHHDHDHEHGGEVPVVDLLSRRVDVRGELRNPFSGVERIRLRASHTDYAHDELEHGEVSTTFTNRGRDARLELQHAPVAGLRGVVGLQTSDNDFAALGVESFIRPSSTRSNALFVLEEASFGDWRFEGALRQEWQQTRSEGLPDADHSPFSASVGASWDFTPGYTATLSAARSQRAPHVQELYADGVHMATNTYELGDAGLSEETVHSLELGLRKTDGPLTFALNTYRYGYDGYIFADTLDRFEAFRLVRYTQADATFTGFEGEIRYQLSPEMAVSAFGDRVHAKLDDGEDLPRIPAARAGLRADVYRGPWSGNVEWTHVFEQTRIADFETRTPGYDMINATLAYDFDLGGTSSQVYVRGTNLLDELAQNHASFISDLAPQRGRGFLVGLRTRFGAPAAPAAMQASELPPPSVASLMDREPIQADRAAAQTTAGPVTNRLENATVTSQPRTAVPVLRQPTLPEAAAVDHSEPADEVAQLDEIVVTATAAGTSSRRAPGPVTVITAVDIERKQVTNITDLLRGEIPGLFVVGSGQNDWTTQLYVRGDTTWNNAGSDIYGDYMKVIIDDVEVTRPTLLSLIDPKSIERIEIVRGPQVGAMYGAEGSSGLLQIRTKQGSSTPGRPEVIVQASLGVVQGDHVPEGVTPLQQDHAIQIYGGDESFSYRLGGTYGETGSWVPGYHSETRAISGGVRGRHGPFTAAASVFHVERDLILSTFDYSCRYPSRASLPRCQPDYNVGGLPYAMSETLAALTVDYQATERWDHRLTFGYDQNRFGYEGPSSFKNSDDQRRTVRYLTSYDANLGADFTARFTAGADYSLYERTEFSANVVERVDGKIDLGTGFIESLSNNWSNLGYFGLVEFGYQERLYLTLAGRVDDGLRNVGAAHDRPFQPRIGMSWLHEAGPALIKLRAQWGESARPPAVNLMDGSSSASLVTLPAPDLKPETKVGWDAGVDLIWRNRGSLSVTRYDEEGRDLVMLVNLDTVSRPRVRQYQNVGVIGSSGWEVEGSLWLGPVSLRGNFTLSDNTIEKLSNFYVPGPNQTWQVGDRPLSIPKHSGGITATMDLLRGHVSVNTSWIGPRRQQDFVGPMDATYLGTPRPTGRDLYIDYPTIWRVNLRIEQDLTDDLTVFGRIDNLLNEQSADRINFQVTPGRTTVIGVRRTF